MAEKIIEVELRLVHETEDAFCFSNEDSGREGEWVPKSVVEWHPDSRSSKSGTAVMPESWAVKKGFV